MKTVLKIIAILLVAIAVSGSFYAIVNGAAGSSALPAGGAAFTDANGQTFQPPARNEGDFEGGHESGASLGGLLGVFGTLVKLSVIGALVYLVEKWINRPARRVPDSTPA